jgi:hypothetical protein
MAARTANGTWVDVHTVRSPLIGSAAASTPRVSSGMPATRGYARRALTTTSASAKPRAGSPVAPPLTLATLSGHSSITRGAPGAAAASTVTAAGSGSYSIATRSTASAAT